MCLVSECCWYVVKLVGNSEMFAFFGGGGGGGGEGVYISCIW